MQIGKEPLFVYAGILIEAEAKRLGLTNEEDVVELTTKMLPGALREAKEHFETLIAELILNESRLAKTINHVLGSLTYHEAAKRNAVNKIFERFDADHFRERFELFRSEFERLYPWYR